MGNVLVIWMYVLSEIILTAALPQQLALNVMQKQLVSLWQHTTELRKRVDNHHNFTCHRNSVETKSPMVTVMHIFRDCNEIYQKGHTQSGVYAIHIFSGFYSIPIYCDMDTTGIFSGKKGWMSIQRRINGRVNFDRGWNDYLDGFGFPDQDHWIGLRNILRITRQKLIGEYDMANAMLRIDIEDYDGNVAYMEHDSFELLSEKFDFAIANLGRYNATKGLSDGLGYNIYSAFSTHDHNNDPRRTETCVKSQRGGWWFGHCYNINLNGVYSTKNEKMTKEKNFIRDWKAVNPNYSALRYISIKLQ